MARHAVRATYGRRARSAVSSRTSSKSKDWKRSSYSSEQSSESETSSSSSGGSSDDDEAVSPIHTRSSSLTKSNRAALSNSAGVTARTPKRAALVEVQTVATVEAAPKPRRIAPTPQPSVGVSSSSVINSLAALKGKAKAVHAKVALVDAAPPTSSSAPPSSPSPIQRSVVKSTVPRRPQRSAAGAARKMLAAIGSEDTPSPPPKPSAYVGYGTTAQATVAAIAAAEAERTKSKSRRTSGVAHALSSEGARVRRSRAKRQEEDVEAALVAQMGQALNMASLSSSSSSSSSSSRTLSSPPPETPATSVYCDVVSVTPIQALLSACEQSSPTPFPTLLATLAASASGKAKRWSKVGEASFSEVFGLDGRVLKIIPLRCETPPALTQHDEEEEWPEESSAQDVAREVRLMRATQHLRGFVRLVSAHVVRGAYPVCLLKAWDAYDARKEQGSENVRPSCLPQTQLYTVLVLAHGGTDVEGVKLPGWVQAASVFWQVVDALARAEEACRFEHRDLHWGNVLVSLTSVTSKPLRTPKQITSPASPLRRRARLSASKQPSSSTFARPSAGVVERLLDPETSGARATIIDLSLSRAVCEGQVLAYRFDEESLFEGEGDEQFDVYRDMRDLANGAWQEHHPLTNIMWLAYLARKLLRDKNLRRPGAPQRVVSGGSLSGAGGSATLSVSGIEVSAYNSLVRAETCARAVLAAAAEGAQLEIESAADLIAWAL